MKKNVIYLLKVSHCYHNLYLIQTKPFRISQTCLQNTFICQICESYTELWCVETGIYSMRQNYPNYRVCVGGAGAGPPTCKMGTFFHIPLALTIPISNNFQSNRALGETPKLCIPIKVSFAQHFCNPTVYQIIKAQFLNPDRKEVNHDNVNQ